MSKLQFQIATEPDDIRQIRALNYRTFVEEIPQHGPNSDHSLADRFERESVFFVCRNEGQIVGMIALRSNRPFSLDAKLPDLDSYLPAHQSPCEIRLLAVEATHRNGRILTGLLAMVHRYFQTRGHDLALISGTLRQTKLYEHMGFIPFGPVVGSADAPYQPMCLPIDRFRQRVAAENRLVSAELLREEVNLLPGPVYLAPAVQAALVAKPVSHRSDMFKQQLERTRRMLCELTDAPAVVIAVGSGTLANDLIAGQLAQLPSGGLILSNGEFGRRLIDHATRLQLQFETLEVPWGEAFCEDDIRRALGQGEPKTWLWAVHAETSTGVLNDLDTLKRLAAERQIRLCLDCISSLGIVPCDLRGVSLASGVSGKGLRSMAGLALVFHDRDLPLSVRPLPRYLDLRLYLGTGVPFTLPSGLLTALALAVETLAPGTRYPALRETADWLCERLLAAGIRPLAGPAARFPGAVTIPLPAHLDCCAVGDALQSEGWLLSYQSEYLVDRNWLQVCVFGSADRAKLEGLPALLAAKMGD
ncbi:MAG: GNAT family N-acetyltransferase [Victivallales bacterium]|nr:GNAT family N-acetyltransferase [Victivallales bacterium]